MKMKSLFFSLMFVFAGVASSSAQDLTIKSSEAKVSFYFTAEKVKGTIGGFDAKITFNPSEAGSGSMSGIVKVATISTGIEKRDKHLKSADYFNAAKYPNIKFTSSKIESVDGGYKMTGKLKIKGVEKDVTFKFKYEEGKLIGKSVVYGKDFGIMDKKKREETQIKVKVVVPAS